MPSYADYINGRQPLGSSLSGPRADQMTPLHTSLLRRMGIDPNLAEGNSQQAQSLRRMAMARSNMGVFQPGGSTAAPALPQRVQPMGALTSGPVPQDGLPQYGGTPLPAGTVVPGQGPGHWQLGAGGKRTWIPAMAAPPMALRGMGQRRYAPIPKEFGLPPRPIDGGYGGPVYPKEPAFRKRPVMIPL